MITAYVEISYVSKKTGLSCMEVVQISGQNQEVLFATISMHIQEYEAVHEVSCIKWGILDIWKDKR